MKYLIIDRCGNGMMFKKDIDGHDCQSAWNREIIIVDVLHEAVLFGSDWISMGEFNELVEAGEAELF